MGTLCCGTSERDTDTYFYGVNLVNKDFQKGKTAHIITFLHYKTVSDLSANNNYAFYDTLLEFDTLVSPLEHLFLTEKVCRS